MAEQGAWVPELGCYEIRRTASAVVPPSQWAAVDAALHAAGEERRAASQSAPPERRVTASTNVGEPSMIINGQNLQTLFLAYNAAFQQGFGTVKPRWQDIAMRVPSNTLEEEYGWLGMFPQIRKWLGDRVINRISATGYRIRNRDFESTITVPRNNVEDDRIGIFGNMFTELGRGAAEHPDRLVFGLLGGGFAMPCYDNQYFFDTDHSVLDAAGKPYSVANYKNGAGPAWYLLDTSRSVRPIVYQERRPFSLVHKDNPSDDNVFFRKEYIYGTDGRSNVGFGFWQLAYASKAPLTAENYEAARAAMSSLRGDFDHPLGIVPNVLVVPTALEGAGRRLLSTQLKSQSTTLDNPGGGTITVTGAGSNEWAG